MAGIAGVIEHVARRIAEATETVPFGDAVRRCEWLNDQGEGFTVGDAAGLRLTDEDFLTAVSLVITWNRADNAPPARHVGQSAMCARLGINRSTFVSWKRRYAGTTTPVPTADVEVVELTAAGGLRVRLGWTPGRVLQVEHWVRDVLPGLRRRGGWPKGKPRRGN